MATKAEYAGLLLRSGSVSWPERRESVGEGSYGAVYSVTVDGFPCIAKKLHDVLRTPDASSESRTTVSEKFMDECKTLSTLHHPNIVQFMGIHVNEGSAHDVSLIMEGLYTDLDKFLENSKNVPLCLKISFLLDASNALVYLHMLSPEIIHRDVKAANVLLTRDMRAKLADLGTSKLLKFSPLTNTQYTQCPGTLGIMPPEALQMVPKYDTKLDAFSFGTLILHTVNQEFPLACEVSRAKKKGELQIAKRQEAIGKLDKHCLHGLVIQCLQDEPSKRPTMEKMRNELQKLSKQHPYMFTNFYDMYLQSEDLKRKLVAAEVWSARIEKLATENSRLEIQAKQTLEQMQMAKSQAAIFKEDFEAERKDRERAAGEYDTKERRLIAEQEGLLKHLQTEKEHRIRLENELKQLRSESRERQNLTKTLGATRFATTPRSRPLPTGSRFQHGDESPDPLLQSLKFDVAEHSSTGYRCIQRYEWYQTSSDVVIEIMIQNIKEDDIVVEFTKEKVKVFIDTGASPYRLSIHMSHDIVPDKCTMKIMKAKVELRLKKAEGVTWQTLDKRGAEPTASTYFQKWDSISEVDDEEVIT